MNKDWKKAIVYSTTTIRQTLGVIDAAALKIGLVIDQQNFLLGTVTDGDIRRGILRGINLDENIEAIMNRQPIVVKASQSKENILAMMRQRDIFQVPVVSEDGQLVGLEIMEDFFASSPQDNWVVLMAGGLGTRLRPITDNCPKPMLEVGGRPILETILNNFIEYRFRKFFIAVNYKGEMIESYFGDGSRWGVEIKYIREDKRLGTAGALSLLEDKPMHPLIVMNADVLTKINFQHLLTFHQEHAAVATMCVREYDFQVPYGVAVVDHHRLVSLEEKPVHSFFVNAGIYVLNPDVMQLIPDDTFYDMPTVLDDLLKNKQETTVFPIREYWLDLGRRDDFIRAQGEYEQVFE